MKNRFAFLVLFGTLSLFTTGVDAGRDLRINGDFRGAAAPGRPALGWTAAGNGEFRTLPGRKSGDFILEISASADGSALAVSEFHPATGNVLELEAELSGSGVGSIGYEGFDATCRKMLAADRRSVRLETARYEVKHRFRLSDPEIRFVRIVLAAEPGSIARFGDVEAEFENAAVPVPATALALRRSLRPGRW